MGALEQKTRGGLERYVDWCRRHGFSADLRMTTATEVVEPVVRMCEALAREFPRAIFFTGKLIFQEERFYQTLLHNETAYAIQNQLQFDGLQSVILPIRVL